MPDQDMRLQAVVVAAEQELRIDLPISVFSTAAEQLRFDALRAGLLNREEWPKAEVTVTPTSLDGAMPSDAFSFVFTLLGGRTPVRKVYQPDRVDRLRLLLQARTGRAMADSNDRSGERAGEASVVRRVKLYWTNAEEPVRVRLSPLQLPIGDSPRPPASSTLDTARLVVTDRAKHCLDALGRESARRGVELGGALLGLLPDLDTVIVDRVVRAPDEGGRTESFAFDPAFWGRLSTQAGIDSNLMVGWVHSHLAARGHTSSLSFQDLHMAHMHFNTPWWVTSLVCAAPDDSQTRWFHWVDGALASVEPHTESVPSHMGRRKEREE